MWIRRAELPGRGLFDLRLADGRIAALEAFKPTARRPGFDAAGGALLPGLHDHHLHLLALAATLDSVPCGPPSVCDASELARALARAQAGRDGWIRGVGYHETVAGALDRAALDRLAPLATPLRIQHRSGALWMLNGAGVRALGLDAGVDATGVERDGAGRATGRLLRADALLRERLAPGPPNLAAVGRLLARRGVTGVTDATPHNGAAELALVTAAQQSGALPQQVVWMGGDKLPARGASHPAHPVDRAKPLPEAARRAQPFDRIRGALHPAHPVDRAEPLPEALRPAAQPVDRADAAHTFKRADCVAPRALKLLLDEGALPTPEQLRARIATAHAGQRPVAIHCVTRATLVVACAAIEAAGPHPADRIEHASVAPPELVNWLRRLGVSVVTQPNFILERGDEYAAEVEARDRRWLYRCAGFDAAGVPLGGGTDAPFGAADPWRAMRAAVERRTRSGQRLGGAEAVSPERALALFTTPPEAPGGAPRRVAVGAAADLCLLACPWREARTQLDAGLLRATWRAGTLIFDRAT